eukprot:896598-Pelagomonas_calceolata.AAC.1
MSKVIIVDGGNGMILLPRHGSGGMLKQCNAPDVSSLHVHVSGCLGGCSFEALQCMHIHDQWRRDLKHKTYDELNWHTIFGVMLFSTSLNIMWPNFSTGIYPNTLSAVWLIFAFVSIPQKSSRPHGMTLFLLLVIYVMPKIMCRMNNTFFPNALIPMLAVDRIEWKPSFSCDLQLNIM